MDKKEAKMRKKAYKKARRKYTQPWKALGIICLLFALVLSIVFPVVKLFDNTMAAYAGGSFWKLINEDPDAQYFTSDFASTEAMVRYGLELVEQVEAEGAALLRNENSALPLAKGSRVSLFSTSSVNLVYGGTGSGNIDASTADNLRSALEKCGFVVNDVLWDFYATGAAKEYSRAGGGMVSLNAATLAEAPWSVYTDDVKASFDSFGDSAIVVFSRVGGEGADLTFDTYNYLELDANEREMLANVSQLKQQGVFKNVVVLINSANALQVDFLKDEAYDVDSVLWIGDVGISGINAVAKILCGDVNPSGSLVDTYCYDNYSSPAMLNFVPISYAGNEGKVIPAKAETYMIYAEGIYVGYKYYETRYEDAVLGTGNAGSFDYDSVVAYPFGYGLSYTNFEYSGFSIKENKDGTITANVTVTNTGDVAGKETVQLYSQSPYTDYDRENLVEKASVNLVGFGKTAILAPGQSETLTIAVDKRDIASYDAYGAGTYILDDGTYYLTAATDSHNAVNNIISVKQGEENELVATWEQAKFDSSTYAVSKAGTEIKNQLSSADLNLYEGSEQTVTYLSRQDWEGTWPSSKLVIDLTSQLIADLQEVQYKASDYENIAMPVLGAKTGFKLVDMIGKDYDDPEWEQLLNQLSYKEMVSLIGDAFHWTMPVLSVQAPGSRDENGPQGLTASLFSGSEKLTATALTSEDVMAATFNTELMDEVGKVVGNNCLSAGVAILYGPGNNIHRTPYGGRNFEYYSEDGFLSGRMSAHEVAAIEAKGVHVVMKHFALNDCEQDRIGLGVWLGEQAARELYLKAFQEPFEEGNAGGVMTAYTRWGTCWSGSNYGLMTGIMRNEWGSKGLSITDNILTTYCNGVDAIMAGGVTIFDAMLPYITMQLPNYENDPVVVAAMKEAVHHDLYALANSIAMNGVGEKTTVAKATPSLVSTAQYAFIAAWALTILFYTIRIIRKGKFKKTDEYREYYLYKKSLKLK